MLILSYRYSLCNFFFCKWATGSPSFIPLVFMQLILQGMFWSCKEVSFHCNFLNLGSHANTAVIFVTVFRWKVVSGNECLLSPLVGRIYYWKGRPENQTNTSWVRSFDQNWWTIRRLRRSDNNYYRNTGPDTKCTVFTAEQAS